MAEPEPESAVGTEPRRSELRRILEERPEARPRLSRAVASLLAVALVAIATLGLLLIWHMARRARLIREGLGRPRRVRWPGIEAFEIEPEAASETPTPNPNTPGPRRPGESET